MNIFRGNKGAVILAGLCIVSALAVVTVRHQNRLAYIDLRKVEEVRWELEAERGRLMLERATWAARRNIEQDARTRLGMNAPAETVTITLQK